MRGRIVILGVALILCASMTQVVSLHRTLASITTYNVEPPLPPGGCAIQYQDATKTFVADGKIFTNIYTKKVSTGVCTEEYRPKVRVTYVSYKPYSLSWTGSNPIIVQEQELGKGSSPDKWGTIVNSFQAACTGFCALDCIDPDAKNQCRVEITLLPSAKTKQLNQELAQGLYAASTLTGKYGTSASDTEYAACDKSDINPSHVTLKFYLTLGEHRKAAVKENPKLAT